MARLTPVDKEIIRAMIDALATGADDDVTRFAAIFDGVAGRYGPDRAWRSEAVAPWVNARR